MHRYSRCPEHPEKIVKEKKVDYVLGLKGNHETLYNEVQDYYLDAETDGF